MKVLITGGAGFLGRWLVRRYLGAGHEVAAFDNLSNGSERNIAEFAGSQRFRFIRGDVLDRAALASAFEGAELCVHAAAQINVQESLDFPGRAVQANIIGTYNVLEECRARKAKAVLIGTCMVYDLAGAKAIGEGHPVKPASPYAASKLAAEELALSYHYGYGLPVVILRPFNIYGPFQKSNMEGGVVGIFIRRRLEGQGLDVFGDGKQTRDLLYVEDCADFVYRASMEAKAVGQVLNAGTGRDISINDLAKLVLQHAGRAPDTGHTTPPRVQPIYPVAHSDTGHIRHVPHHHPQAEIRKLLCDYSRARKLLGWEPATMLEEGIRKTAEWMRAEAGA